MTPAERYNYDAFAKRLADLYANEMLFLLEEEIADVRQAAEVRHSAAEEITRQTYLRKLSRIVLFLRRNEIPVDLTPSERRVFAMLAQGLVKKGEMSTRVWLAIAQGA